jgi:hypothetical protein
VATPKILNPEGLMAIGDHFLLRFHDAKKGYGFHRVAGSAPRWDFHLKKLLVRPALSVQQLVIAAQFDDASEFADGVAAVRKGDVWGIIDEKGSFMATPSFAQIGEQPVGLDAQAFREGLAPARDGDLWGYLRRDGSWAIAPAFAEARKFSEELAWVRLPERTTWSLIQRRGHIVADTPYEAVTPFSEGLAAVKPTDQGWCFAGPDGNILLNYRRRNPKLGHGYKGAFSFSEGMAVVQLDGGAFGYLNAKGKVPFLRSFPDALGFFFGLAAVKEGDLWGYINPAGRMKIIPQYDQAGSFIELPDGSLGAQVRIDGMDGIVRKDGAFEPR